MKSTLLVDGTPATLDRIPVVARRKEICDTQLLRPFCSFLLLFATFHAWDVQIQSTNLRELSAALLLLGQYYISSSIYDSDLLSQIRSITGNQPQNISCGLQIISIISSPWPQLKWFLSDHSSRPGDQAQQSLSSHAGHVFCLPYNGSDHWARYFSPVVFIKESILCKTIVSFCGQRWKPQLLDLEGTPAMRRAYQAAPVEAGALPMFRCGHDEDQVVHPRCDVHGVG
jgi:hypothetical protein